LPLERAIHGPPADGQPDHSTITAFVSPMADVIAPLFTQALMVSDGLNLIGRAIISRLNSQRLSLHPAADGSVYAE